MRFVDCLQETWGALGLLWIVEILLIFFQRAPGCCTSEAFGNFGYWCAKVSPRNHINFHLSHLLIGFSHSGAIFHVVDHQDVSADDQTGMLKNPFLGIDPGKTDVKLLKRFFCSAIFKAFLNWWVFSDFQKASRRSTRSWTAWHRGPSGARSEWCEDLTKFTSRAAEQRRFKRTMFLANCHPLPIGEVKYIQILKNCQIFLMPMNTCLIKKKLEAFWCVRFCWKKIWWKFCATHRPPRVRSSRSARSTKMPLAKVPSAENSSPTSLAFGVPLVLHRCSRVSRDVLNHDFESNYVCKEPILCIYKIIYNLRSKSLESRVILAHRLFCQCVRL